MDDTELQAYRALERQIEDLCRDVARLTRERDETIEKMKGLQLSLEKLAKAFHSGNYRAVEHCDICDEQDEEEEAARWGGRAEVFYLCYRAVAHALKRSRERGEE